jgi:excisionase family DNA binding protein
MEGREPPSCDLANLLTVDDVARVLALRPSTVRTYCEDRRLAHVRIGGRLRFKAEDIAEWIEHHRVRRRNRKSVVEPSPDSAIS